MELEIEFVYPRNNLRPCIPDRIGIWKSWFLRGEGKTGVLGEKSLEARRKPLNNLNLTRATLVGGECSHHCAIPASPGSSGGAVAESTRLPPMWLGFDSQTQRHMWVEFVGSLLCTEKFSPGTPVSPLLKNQHLTWFAFNVNFSLQCPQLQGYND